MKNCDGMKEQARDRASQEGSTTLCMRLTSGSVGNHTMTIVHSHRMLAWQPLLFGPELAMDSSPGPVCRATKLSSANLLPYMLIAPVPSPCKHRVAPAQVL